MMIFLYGFAYASETRTYTAGHTLLKGDICLYTFFFCIFLSLSSRYSIFLPYSCTRTSPKWPKAEGGGVITEALLLLGHILPVAAGHVAELLAWV